MDKETVYFIGIGGAGMSSLARYFLAQKWAVFGSDIVESPVTTSLKKEGIKVKIGQKRENITKDISMVVYSQAVRPDNPEFKEAMALGIKTISYPKAVGEITKEYKTITISGAHGKSTTTALVSLILKKAKMDPTVIIGVNLKEFNWKNFILGKSDYLILEADEFGRAFLNYSPSIAIITNIDKEHLDTYKNLPDIKNTFLQFLSNVKSNGIVIINKDNENCFLLKERINRIAQKNNFKVIWYSLEEKESVSKIRNNLSISGDHNVSNALAAYHLAKYFDISDKNILSTLSSYNGAQRRMEFRGKFELKDKNTPKKIEFSIYDDYAHHPTEIKTTLKAFKEKFPKNELVCIFQPHQANRFLMLYREFQEAFLYADISIIAPIYKVAGRDELLRINSQTLVNEINKHHKEKQTYYLDDLKNIKKILKQIFFYSGKKIENKKMILVMMGAGDIVNYTKDLLKKDLNVN
jgi:UDP-N-acetylmuramate--alanine ligase